MLLIGHLGKSFSEILVEIDTILFLKNAFENVVCTMAAILSQSQCDILYFIMFRD